jgi:phosphopantetheinyl transferase
MPKTHILVHSSSPEVIIAEVSVSNTELNIWAPKQVRFPERDVPSHSSHKQREHYAVNNAMLHFDAPWSLAKITHDANGKPKLSDGTSAISISHHSKGDICWVVICIGPDFVGCDIEHTREQLHSISKRFLSEREQNDFKTTALLCCAWGIKESMFKSIGSDVDFRADLEVDPFSIPQTKSFDVTGKVRGQASHWRIWKINPTNEGNQPIYEMYAVAGPIID